MNKRLPNKPYKRRKEDIINLRAKGLSFRAIAKKLGCSKGTVSYHCGDLDSEKKRVQGQARTPLSRKVNSFKSRCTKASWRTFRAKVKCFKKRSKGTGKARTTWRIHNVSKNYTCKDVVDKIGSSPICYLTGRKINLNNPKEYSLDHLIPIAMGGTNDLDNLEVCCTEANHAKAGLSLEDFYTLCEEILAWRDKNKK